MRITREQFAAGLVLVCILAVFGGVHQFYYKERWAEYKKNVEHLEALEQAYDTLSETFEGYEPEVLIGWTIGQVGPLEREVLARAEFFNTGDFLEIDPIPQGRMLRFYYKEEFEKKIREMRADARSRVPYCPYPETTFGAPHPDGLAGSVLSPNQVATYLRKINFGCSMIRMLMDADAVQISRVELWPPRKECGGLLNMHTVGLRFVMRLEDLTKFLDERRLDDRYFTVDAINIQNRYLSWPVAPPVEVRMLLTQADFIPPMGRVAGAPGEQPAGPAQPTMRQGMTPQEILMQQGFGAGRTRESRRGLPKTRWQRFKRWFGRYFWPFG